MAGVVYLHNCIYMGKPLGSRFWQFITLYNYQFVWAIAFNFRTPPPPRPAEDLPFHLTFEEFH